ncbi:hypothetical protein D3218_19080 [Aureimonas flava]|uniref:Phage protein Gp138 N-terminal domain-containing protein n=1 Tax=Aureimonas flava TaxID=2320271 RepID=A0A3A1WNP1_9HYPH|nr:Gp138 family membrane-puncturing spike protein [Aureimonas flava]RIX97166.1 hypothetical protein D3218_19080 [Aureimonas flava]
MVGNVGKTTNNLIDQIEAVAQAEREDQWGEMPGRIVAFDAAKQSATIQPLYMRVMNGQPMALPELLEVPVRFSRSGRGSITFPVQVGDRVTLRPQMRSSEKYHADPDQADGYVASDTRTYNLSDMEAHLDGGESLLDPIQNFDAENTHVRFDGEGKFGIKGSADGKISIEGSEGNVYDIIASMFELIATDELLIKHGSSSGSGHALQNRDQLIELAAKLRSMAL